MQQGDSTYNFFNQLDTFLAQNVTDKNLHKFIINKDNSYFVRFKLYENTVLFLGHDELPVKSLMSFYDVLQTNTKLRLVFSFSHSWEFDSKFGFSATVSRIQIDEATFNSKALDELKFYD